MTAMALALATLLAGSPRTDLTLVCDGCFAMQVDLDGEHLLHVDALGGARVQQGQLGTSRDARFEGLPPGLHHLKVEVFQGPLNPTLYYDGQVYLRPGASVRLKVKPGSLEDLTPAAPLPPLPAPLPDGGLPPLAPARLVVRADDEASCAIALDGVEQARLQKERVVAIERLAPGLHHLEVRTLQGKALSRGTLFLGSGQEEVLGVRCQTGAARTDADPGAFHAQP